MQSASEHAISAANTVPLITTEKSVTIASAPHCIAATPQRIKSLFPVLLLLPFTALGFFLAWLLESSSVLLGQKPDRTTQVLMVLMCIGPAAALVIFRARKPDETQR